MWNRQHGVLQTTKQYPLCRMFTNSRTIWIVSLNGPTATSHYARNNLCTYVIVKTPPIFFSISLFFNVLRVSDIFGNLRDLGVMISDDFFWSKHIGFICDTTHQMAAFVFSVFSTQSTDIPFTFYKSLVRCLVEDCSRLRNPSKIADIQKL